MSWRVESVSSPFMTLEVLPEVGASVLNLRAASGEPVMRPVRLEDVKTSSQCASFTLLPYSNRIRDAQFVFQGEEVVLRANTKDGLAQHGDVRNRPWQVARVTDSWLRCEFDSRAHADLNWPWAFTARVEYILHGPHLDTSVTLTNVDDRDMPAGMGLHPYFVRVQDGADQESGDPALSFGAELCYDTDERLLTVGGPRPVQPHEDFRARSVVGGRHIDRTYTGWDGTLRLDWGTRALILTADNPFSHLVVYTAPDGSLALEPTSHATDAVNLAAQGIGGVDLRVLQPGQSLAGTARVTLEGEWG